MTALDVCVISVIAAGIIFGVYMALWALILDSDAAWPWLKSAPRELPTSDRVAACLYLENDKLRHELYCALWQNEWNGQSSSPCEFTRVCGDTDRPKCARCIAREEWERRTKADLGLA